MMSPEKIAIVTGANRGVGLAICKGLCQRFPGVVYLTSRDQEKGLQSVATLKEFCLNPFYHKLDVNDQTSIDRFKKHIEDNHGGVDVIINNASIGFGFNLVARQIINTNYYGTLRMCQSFIPLLRQDARIVNVTCSSGHFSKIRSQEIRTRFADSNITVTRLNDLINEYIAATEDKSKIYDVVNNWGGSDFVVSKVDVSALTRLFQNTLNREIPTRNVLVNSVNTGFADSNNTERAAMVALNLVLEPHALMGEFVWSDNSVIDWMAVSTPE